MNKIYKKLSIIIPVYNEQRTIKEVLEKVTKADTLGLVKEVIVVDDASTDSSYLIIQNIIREKNIKIMLLSSVINLGKGASVRIGMRHATGDILLVQDADLELDPVSSYKKLLSPIMEGDSEVVYGSRFLTRAQKVSLTTHIANFFLTWLTNILFGSHLTDMETAYKVFTRGVLESLKLTAMRFEFEPEFTSQVLKNQFKIIEVPVTYNQRTKAEGKKISYKDGLIAVITLFKCRFR